MTNFRNDMPASAGFLISPAMNKSPAPSVYFIGLGALGILYAKAIENALGKHSVTFAADKNAANATNKKKFI